MKIINVAPLLFSLLIIGCGSDSKSSSTGERISEDDLRSSAVKEVIDGQAYMVMEIDEGKDQVLELSTSSSGEKKFTLNSSDNEPDMLLVKGKLTIK